MADIRLKNLPDELHERLRRQARKRKTTLDDVVLSMLERQMERIEFKGYVADKMARKRAERQRHLTR